VIKADKANRQPSERILKRSAKMRAELIQHLHEAGEDIAEVRVEPDEIGKAVRIVSFHKRGDDIRISCFNEETLVACDGNRYGLMCSHAFRAIQELLEITEGEDSDVTTELQK
jgi:hypothetical protein